ncbi:MAG: hypothetical protein COV45_06385 [Deltaproteobacteria bacterium CG11_big_fil_rev_8_21_14_0_20_47_16]|nr:MAG: hypothetical protein COV45_06385 [Deltaproteobacteria bacterium CG11_big_fil_rev_8_21_14_0_20_47_16]
MKRSIVLLAAALLIPLAVIAKEIALPKLPDTGYSMQDFVPNGWVVKSVSKGNLDDDGKTDVAMVLVSKAETDGINDDTEKLPRLLVILTRTKRGGYKLSVATAKAILCKNCSTTGDAVDDVMIEDGMVKIHHHGGKDRQWDVVHRFQYREGTWFLVGKKVTTSAGKGKPGQTVDVDFVNGQKIEQPAAPSKMRQYGFINFTPVPLSPIDSFNVGMNIEDMNNW